MARSSAYIKWFIRVFPIIQPVLQPIRRSDKSFIYMLKRAGESSLPSYTITTAKWSRDCNAPFDLHNLVGIPLCQDSYHTVRHAPLIQFQKQLLVINSVKSLRGGSKADQNGGVFPSIHFSYFFQGIDTQISTMLCPVDWLSVVPISSHKQSNRILYRSLDTTLTSAIGL